MKTTKKIETRSSALLLLALFLSACRGNELYNSYTAIEADGWKMYDAKAFAIDIPATGSYDVELFVRHNSQYPYRNLWLFIDHTTPHGVTTTDTINIAMADAYGQWNGGGWGTAYQIKQTLHLQHPLDSGSHTIKISHAMREYQLRGINNIGVTITPAGE